MLTDLACRRAAPRATAYKLSDAFGLYLYVLPSGYRSWRWKYRVAGKEKVLVFGPYPAVTLAKARQLREEAARSLREGIDPSISRRQRAAAQAAVADATFERIARDWHRSQLPMWSARYASNTLNNLVNDVFPKIGRLPISAVTPPLVLEVLRPIEARGAVDMAHRTRQRISEVFARAIALGLVETDPASVTRRALARKPKGKYPAVRTIEQARHVLLATEQQPAHPLTKLASRLLALTAVRSATLRLAEPHEFEDLDGPEPIWRVPAAKLKLGVEDKRDPAFEFVVPLSRQAVEVVKVAIGFSAGRFEGLIFRSVRQPRRPISDSTLSKGYREAGFSGAHVPHGWRATFSTVMNERAEEAGRTGDRAIIDLMLAHVPSGVEAAYNRASFMRRRREIAQEWADLLTVDLPRPSSCCMASARAAGGGAAMMARSLHEIVTAVGPKRHRAGQPVRRSSYRIGMREGDFWSAFDRRERNARMRAAERYDREGKQPGKRNGPLGHIAIEVLREMMRIIDFRTGRLDPSIDYLAERLRRTRGAVHAALKRLRAHGFLDWFRRFAPREDAEPFGPQIRQISNAYRLTLPQSAAELVRRLLGRSPPPDDDVTRRREEEERVAAMLATLSAEELARFRVGDTALGRELARLGRAIDRNAIPPSGLNPALRG